MIRPSRLFPVMAAAVLGAQLFAAAPASAGLIKVGVLTCRINGGTGMIFYSKKPLKCVFTSVSGRMERYSGSISKFGLDVGRTTGTSLIWKVFAPGSTRRGALAGTYAGATAQVTAGAGLGANVLVGGARRTINLQPASITAQTGFNIAAGVAGLTLRRAR